MSLIKRDLERIQENYKKKKDETKRERNWRLSRSRFASYIANRPVSQPGPSSWYMVSATDALPLLRISVCPLVPSSVPPSHPHAGRTDGQPRIN